MPYEVKWGLIIEYQCSSFSVMCQKGKQGGSEEGGKEGCFPLKMAVG